MTALFSPYENHGVDAMEFRLLFAASTPAAVEVLQATVDPQIEDLKHRHAEELSQLRTEMQAQLDAERKQISRIVIEFRSARERYFYRAEQEVVQLSLAIAARILHREAQLDPLMLAGAVRAALDQVTEHSGAVLRVPAKEHAVWLKELADEQEDMTIRPDNDLAPGEYRLETRMGSVDLGVRAQLKEIEQGFFDLLGCKSIAA